MTHLKWSNDPTNLAGSIIAPVQAHSTPAWLITHNNSLCIFPHTINGLYLSQIFIENERAKVGGWVNKWPKSPNDPTNCVCSFAWSPCSRSLLVVWMWIYYLIYILLSIHTVWCDSDEWWSSESAKALVGSMVQRMGRDPYLSFSCSLDCIPLVRCVLCWCGRIV